MSEFRIFPVIVIYKSQLSEALAYKTFLKCNDFSQFMVYDNSPQSFVFDTHLLPLNAVYVRSVENDGVSRAYNTAAEFAISKGYTHLLLLDQDTQFPENILAHYRAYLEENILCAPMLKLKNGKEFSPCIRRSLKTRGVKLSEGKYSLKDYMPVNSGMCIPLRNYMSCGGYNNSVKLDFSDFEFLSRYRLKNHDFQLLGFCCVQDFSNDECSIEKLLFRYKLYVQSANATRWTFFREKIIFNVEVLCHTIALICRTRSFIFLNFYIKYFLLKRKFTL